mgnify:CR=1 FL=1
MARMESHVLELKKFPKGINLLTNSAHLGPDELADAYGFDILDDGELVTEPRWATGDSEWMNGLSTNYTTSFGPLAGLAYGGSLDTQNTSGFYYLAFDAVPAGALAARDLKVCKTYRRPASATDGNLDWNNVAFNPASAAGAGTYDVWLTQFNGRVYLAVSTGTFQGLYCDGATTAATGDIPTISSTFGAVINTQGGTALAPRSPVIHHDRLMLADGSGLTDYYRIRFSAVGNAGGSGSVAAWPDNNYFDIDGYTGSGIIALVSAGSHLYIFCDTSIWTLFGGTISQWDLKNISRGIAPISHKTIWKSPNNEVYFLAQDNNIYKLTGFQMQSMSDQLNRTRALHYVHNLPGGIRTHHHYRVSPVLGSWATGTLAAPNTWIESTAGSQREGNVGYNLNLKNGALTKSAQWTTNYNAYGAYFRDDDLDRAFRFYRTAQPG